jgi:hypothetical protein
MKHIYLSESLIEEALKHHFITENEADKLRKKIDYQSSIFKAINKEA